MRRFVKISEAVAVTATAISAEAFAPFGDVVLPPTSGVRTDWSSAFANNRPEARISLYTSGVAAIGFPASLTMMERHEHSFQSFMPLDASRYLVCVAPGGDGDLPNVAGVRAFIVGAGTGITYRANVWHHPMVALDRTAQFAVLMWQSGGDDDVEFVDLVQPVTVHGA